MNTTKGKPQKSHRKTAILVGVLFLTAMVASLVGGQVFIEPYLNAPDYLAAVSKNETQVIIGVFLELINGIAVVGIGVLMFPILKRHNENIAFGYLSLRIIEAVFCCVIVISPLSLITLSQEYLAAGTSDASYFLSIGALSIAQRMSVANLLIPVFLSLGALVLYISLYQSRYLPRYISVWGFIGAVLILILNLLLTFNVDVGSMGMVFAFPIISNEIFLGIWLIVKGFNPSTIASEPDKLNPFSSLRTADSDGTQAKKVISNESNQAKAFFRSAG